MTTQTLAKSYAPAEAEPEISRRWEQARAFHAEPAASGTPYSVLIPPPNVTAALHLGHALNNTLQDVLVRVHRMRGCNTLWMPGTDHAGIATQTVVDKRLKAEGQPSLIDYKKLEAEGQSGREQFIEKVQAWKDEYEATIIDQLKAMGCSCDFERTRFTMDEMCAKAVREAFFRLFRDGLIYRGKRLVNWDPVTQTALADDEVEMEEVDGFFWYLRYPLVHPPKNPDDPYDCEEVTWSELATRGYPGADQHPDEQTAWVTVATTRPETYLGDTGVAVHPDDPRAKPLRGLMAQLPIVGRVIPIVEDDYVVRPDPESSDPKAQYASGFLKVTPAHDQNDWEIGQRHGLKVINVMAPDASISDQHGWSPEDVGDARIFIGKSREEARQLVVKEFEARGLLEATEPYRHSVGHSYRSHVPIEPYLSDQWYVKVTDDSMKGEALRALVDDQFDGNKPLSEGEKPQEKGGTGDGKLRFYPGRYAKMYQSWHENIRDWCISRQLWWGHRIPVWSGRRSDDSEPQGWNPSKTDDRAASHVVGDIEHVCVRDENDHELVQELQAAGYSQDPDVLDTWFSSALWPLSTMGWPEPEAYPETQGLLDTFNPTSVLCTARDIITLWVSRMVMFNRYFRDGAVPFRHVYIHPMIQDGHGQRMSKSLGNGVDPRDIIGTHGADALRYTLTQMATTTQDVRLPLDLVCPNTGETFTPKTVTTPAGHTVPAPIQTCPSDPNKKMVTAYGVASGQAEPSGEMPLAVNASQKFDLGRNFCNKLWNATRFALGTITDQATPAERVTFADLSLIDRWMFTRLWTTLGEVDAAIGDYQFNVYAESMYDLIWRDFCDWYLEGIKPTVKSDPAQQQALLTILDAMMRMLHPICPFVTETLWPHVQSAQSSGRAGLREFDLPESELCATARWPRVPESFDAKQASAEASEFERLRVLVNAVRQVRSEHRTPPKQKIRLHVPEPTRQLIEHASEAVHTLAGLEAVESNESRPDDAIVFTFEGDEHAVSGLSAHLDRESERKRIEKTIADLETQVASLRKRLDNPGYVNKAPAHLVEETRSQLQQAEADLETARRALQSLES